MTPKMPPATIASICFAEWAMPSHSNTAIGVRSPTKWPRNSPRMPTWKRLLPQTSWRRRKSWLEPLRQVYCSRSNRTRQPSANTLSTTYG